MVIEALRWARPEVEGMKRWVRWDDAERGCSLRSDLEDIVETEDEKQKAATQATEGESISQQYQAE